MDAALRSQLDRLHLLCLENDAAQADRSEKMLNITPQTGEFLRMLIIAGRHQRVLELGTSNGYSTICLKSRGNRVAECCGLI